LKSVNHSSFMMVALSKFFGALFFSPQFCNLNFEVVFFP
jgi:hypothetical protein